MGDGLQLDGSLQEADTLAGLPGLALHMGLSTRALGYVPPPLSLSLGILCVFVTEL